MKIEDIAMVCHEVNKSYCEAIGDNSQTNWSNAPDWQKESAIDGVKFVIKNGPNPELQHKAWMTTKIKDGWIYGPYKDVGLKTHPCMVPHAKLPQEQQVKDHLFGTIVNTLKHFLDGE